MFSIVSNWFWGEKKKEFIEKIIYFLQEWWRYYNIDDGL
jgi:hypothetical protein